MRLAVVAYIVRADGLMLSVPRQDGQHAAPGGKVEPGETPEMALSREVDEEAGLRVLAAWRVHVGQNNGAMVICYRCEVEGQPTAREPGTCIAWVTPEQLAHGFGSRAAHGGACRGWAARCEATCKLCLTGYDACYA